ncbi:Transducin-like enhancer protein 4 [Manis javanica]|nr:Transducin-like enhancer protein 4 [Manis javanica]
MWLGRAGRRPLATRATDSSGRARRPHPDPRRDCGPTPRRECFPRAVSIPGESCDRIKEEFQFSQAQYHRDHHWSPFEIFFFRWLFNNV